eukprot:SAG22_NODE_104_length_20159_cov_5.877517_25_plen_78_part_00
MGVFDDLSLSPGSMELSHGVSGLAVEVKWVVEPSASSNDHRTDQRYRKVKTLSGYARGAVSLQFFIPDGAVLFSFRV